MESNIICSSQYGTVLERESGQGKISVNGEEIAIEDDFIFSYDITSPSPSLLLAIEKGNVTREDYLLDIRKIILSLDSFDYVMALANSIDLSFPPREDEFIIPGVVSIVLDSLKKNNVSVSFDEDLVSKLDDTLICFNSYHKGKDDEYQALKKLHLID